MRQDFRLSVKHLAKSENWQQVHESHGDFVNNSLELKNLCQSICNNNNINVSGMTLNECLVLYPLFFPKQIILLEANASQHAPKLKLSNHLIGMITKHLDSIMQFYDSNHPIDQEVIRVLMKTPEVDFPVKWQLVSLLDDSELNTMDYIDLLAEVNKEAYMVIHHRFLKKEASLGVLAGSYKDFTDFIKGLKNQIELNQASAEHETEVSRFSALNKMPMSAKLQLEGLLMHFGKNMERYFKHQPKLPAEAYFMLYALFAPECHDQTASFLLRDLIDNNGATFQEMDRLITESLESILAFQYGQGADDQSFISESKAMNTLVAGPTSLWVKLQMLCESVIGDLPVAPSWIAHNINIKIKLTDFMVLYTLFDPKNTDEISVFIRNDKELNNNSKSKKIVELLNSSIYKVIISLRYGEEIKLARDLSDQLVTIIPVLTDLPGLQLITRLQLLSLSSLSPKTIATRAAAEGMEVDSYAILYALFDPENSQKLMSYGIHGQLENIAPNNKNSIMILLHIYSDLIFNFQYKDSIGLSEVSQEMVDILMVHPKIAVTVLLQVLSLSKEPLSKLQLAARELKMSAGEYALLYALFDPKNKVFCENLDNKLRTDVNAIPEISRVIADNPECVTFLRNLFQPEGANDFALNLVEESMSYSQGGLRR